MVSSNSLERLFSRLPGCIISTLGMRILLKRSGAYKVLEILDKLACSDKFRRSSSFAKLSSALLSESTPCLESSKCCRRLRLFRCCSQMAPTSGDEPLRCSNSLRARSVPACSKSNPKLTHSTVVVEGNIGSGKAQFLNYLGQEPSVEIFEEPLDLWRNRNGKNLLDLMYKDPKANSFEFQQYVLETMTDLHESGLDKPVSLLERSLYSARYVFVENLRRNGLMTAQEYGLLDAQFEEYRSGTRKTAIDLIVYLRASPETVYKRIMHRGRKEEKFITVEYLRQLHQLYEDWLMHGKFDLPAPVLVIDGEVPLKEVFSQIETHKDRILFGWSDTKPAVPLVPAVGQIVLS